jgi:RNA polymerase sigma factor (sigma-70 family)
MDDSLDEWFAQQILVHEAALTRYLLRCWQQRDEVADLRQEIYVRVYEAAARSLPLQPKSMLFTTARHLMADRWRRGRVVPLDAMADADLAQRMVDEITPDRRLSAQRELRSLVRAFDRLPPRRREVLWLRRVEDLSIKAIAARLGIAPKTVENHLAEATRDITARVLGDSDAVLPPVRSDRAHTGHEDMPGEGRQDKGRQGEDEHGEQYGY